MRSLFYLYEKTDSYINIAKIKSCEMEKLSRNRLFPFHSVRCLKYFDLYG